METKSNVKDSQKSWTEYVDEHLATLTPEEKKSWYKTSLELCGWYPKVLREEKQLPELAWMFYSYSFYVLWKLRDNHE